VTAALQQCKQLIVNNILRSHARYVEPQKVLNLVGRYAMLTLPYRTICAAALLCLAAGNASAADSWDLPVAVGAGLLWVAALAGACCMLLRRCVAAEDQLRQFEAAMCAEQEARRTAEQALAETRRKLSRRIRQHASTRDAERGRIARDIHDDLGQTLLTLRIDLSLMQVATSGIHPVIHAKLGQLARTLDEGLRSLRTVIHDLRPLALGEGLREAMERQVREFSRLSGIAHEFTASDGAFEASQREEALDVVLYRVLQESLSNVARHSHASLVRVHLCCEDDRVALRIQDNGVGMRLEPSGYGCGLAGMRERISAAGGDFLVESGPGAGTLVGLSLPLTHETVAR
jgi:signal transduction histidine kinase